MSSRSRSACPLWRGPAASTWAAKDPPRRDLPLPGDAWSAGPGAARGPPRQPPGRAGRPGSLVGLVGSVGSGGRCAGPGRVAAEEAHQPVDGAGVVGYVDLFAEGLARAAVLGLHHLPTGPERLLDGGIVVG